MVAEECLYLLNFRVGCELRNIEYAPNHQTPYRPIKMTRLEVINKTSVSVQYMGEFCREFIIKGKDSKLALATLSKLFSCFELYPSMKLCKRIISIMQDLFDEMKITAVTPLEKEHLNEKFEKNVLYEIFRALFRIADDDLSGSMSVFFKLMIRYSILISFPL